MADVFDLERLQGLAHETPFFLLSPDKIVEKYQEFAKHFPDAVINYAMKANSEPEVLKTLGDLGANFEVASIYELDMLKALDIPGDKMIFGTSIKPAAHIRVFNEYGVNRYAADSFEELEKIASAAPGSRIYIRVSVNDAGSVFKFSEKFGTDIRNVMPMLIRARDLGLDPYGISFHVGSQASNPKAWAEAVEMIGPVMEELDRTAGIKVTMVNIGGGFPCTYASVETTVPLEEIAGHLFEAYKTLPYKPHLMLEPGRGMVAESSVLVASIIARIERREHTWLFLDAGVYNGLFETMAYQGSTRYRVSSLRLSYDAGESFFALAGPTGDSPDIITREALLPQDLAVGDKLVFHDVGAYSLVACCPFNGFPKPPVYLV